MRFKRGQRVKLLEGRRLEDDIVQGLVSDHMQAYAEKNAIVILETMAHGSFGNIYRFDIDGREVYIKERYLRALKKLPKSTTPLTEAEQLDRIAANFREV